MVRYVAHNPADAMRVCLAQKLTAEVRTRQRVIIISMMTLKQMVKNSEGSHFYVRTLWHHMLLFVFLNTLLNVDSHL